MGVLERIEYQSMIIWLRSPGAIASAADSLAAKDPAAAVAEAGAGLETWAISAADAIAESATALKRSARQAALSRAAADPAVLDCPNANPPVAAVLAVSSARASRDPDELSEKTATHGSGARKVSGGTEFILPEPNSKQLQAYPVAIGHSHQPWRVRLTGSKL